MDSLELRWIDKKTTQGRKAKRSSPVTRQALAVYINDCSLEDLLEDAAQARGIKTLGDVFLEEQHVREFAAGQWLASAQGDSAITLLACGCGHWECSDISVLCHSADNWAHWRFDVNDVYRDHYGELPEFWFDLNAYRSHINSFEFHLT